MPQSKVCALCKVEQPDREYYRHPTKGTLHAYCKSCYAEYNRAKYATGEKRTRKTPKEGELYECTLCHQVMTVNADNFYHYEGRGWVTRCKPCYRLSKKKAKVGG